MAGMAVPMPFIMYMPVLWVMRLMFMGMTRMFVVIHKMTPFRKTYE